MSTSPARILVADDQKDVQEALRLLFKGEGLRTDTCSSPREVVDRLRQSEFDLLLMDLNYTRDTTNTAHLHPNFRLSATADSIGLFAPDQSLVDAVTFGPQAENVSQGGYPNGSGAITSLSQATPGAGNVHNPPVFVPHNVVRQSNGWTTIEWIAQSGRAYRIRYKDDLNLAAWQTLGTVVATSPLKSVTDTTSAGVPKRFYLIELLP